LSAGDVIDVAVRNDNGFDFELVAVENGRDFRDVVSGIHHNRVERFLVAEDRAIALQQTDRKNNVQHVGSLYRIRLLGFETCVCGCSFLGL
jgi:hypothetical protein